MLACATGRRPSASGNWLPGEPTATIDALPIDDPLKTAIAKALSTSPHDRYTDADALLAAIGGENRTYTVGPTPSGTDGHTRTIPPPARAAQKSGSSWPQ